MSRDWNPADHPRDGEGQFAEKATGWAAKIADQAGPRKPVTGHAALQTVGPAYELGDDPVVEDWLEGTMASDINGHLREGFNPTWPDFYAAGSLDEAVEQLDGVMRPSTDAFEVWRGVDGQTLFAGKLDGGMVGVEWTDPGYLSTTTDREVGKAYSEGSQPVLLRIVAPKGTRGLALGDAGPGISGDGEDSEVLLARGLQYRVVEDGGVSNGARRLTVEVVPADWATRAAGG